MKQILFIPQKCIGCQNCVVACNQEHYTQGGAYRKFRFLNKERVGSLGTLPISYSCNNCNEPACAAICPKKCFTVQDGQVVLDSSHCVGCLLCVKKCSYEAVVPMKGAKKVGKCDLCGGDQPQCVKNCPTGALVLIEMDANEIRDFAGDMRQYLDHLKQASMGDGHV